MIVLNRTRESLLAEIGATERTLANRVPTPTDPAFLSDEVSLSLSAGSREELFPDLVPALAKRFPDVSPERFIRDIERPLKRGLGNAFKRGNRGKRDKKLVVEVAATAKGAVIAITNEGPGFDVEGVVRRFRANEEYAMNQGGGLRAFDNADSLISYADEGRTMLIRFLSQGEPPSPGLAGLDDYMGFVLSDLPMLLKRERTVETCRVSVLWEGRTDPLELRYDLEIRDAEGARSAAILTGRLLSIAAARREQAAAKKLQKVLGQEAIVRVPRVTEVFKRHPRLVLYRFDPGPGLRERASSASDPEALNDLFTTVGKGLRAIHDCGVEVDVAGDPASERERRRTSGEAVLRALAGAGLEAQAKRANRFLDELEARASGTAAWPETVPVHGALDWDCVRTDLVRKNPNAAGEDRLVLYRFTECRMSHPGIDVGGFLADLDRATGDGSLDEHLGRGARDSFLTAYSGGGRPAWHADLAFFTAAANLLRCERLVQRPVEEWRADVDALLDRCERALTQ